MTTQPSDELLDKVEEIATLKGELGHLDRAKAEGFGLYVSSNVRSDGRTEIKAAPPSFVAHLIFLVDLRGRRKVVKYHPGKWESTVDATLDLTRMLHRAENWSVPDSKATEYHADEKADRDDPKWGQALDAWRSVLAEHKAEVRSLQRRTDEATREGIRGAFFDLLADEWPVEYLELLRRHGGADAAMENATDSYVAGYAVGKGWLSPEHLDSLLIDSANEIVGLVRQIVGEPRSRRYPFVEAFRKVAALGVAAAEESVETSAEGVYESAGARRGPESSREKKRRLRAELTARSEERELPPPLQGDTGAKASPDVPRWVGYAAFGLFIIGLVSFLLPWLVFCFWCYRRGRREGAALTEDVEPPLPYFSARLTGWFLATILLPIVDWFTAVHVPTMCYQQGLRVGAAKGTASESFTEGWELALAAVIPTVLLWVGMAGVAFAVLVTEDNEQPALTAMPSPTPSWQDRFAAAFAATPQAERVSFEEMPEWEKQLQAAWWYESLPPDEQESLRTEYPGLFEWLTGQPTAMTTPSPTAWEDWVAAAEAALAEAQRTATTTPSPWQALTYDQQHEVCVEAAELFEQEANAHAGPGRVWPTAKPTFYTKCMECGGPTQVYAYVTEDERLGVRCVGSWPGIPDGATQFWP